MNALKRASLHGDGSWTGMVNFFHGEKEKFTVNSLLRLTVKIFRLQFYS